MPPECVLGCYASWSHPSVAYALFMSSMLLCKALPTTELHCHLPTRKGAMELHWSFQTPAILQYRVTDRPGPEGIGKGERGGHATEPGSRRPLQPQWLIPTSRSSTSPLHLKLMTPSPTHVCDCQRLSFSPGSPKSSLSTYNKQHLSSSPMPT